MIRSIDKEGLPLTEKLLPQFLKEAGYRTGWIGKWHLGAAPAFAPWARGFDETFGFIGGGHRFTGWQPNAAPIHAPAHPQRRNRRGAAASHHRARRRGRRVFPPAQGRAVVALPAFNAPHTPHEPTAGAAGKIRHIQNPQRRNTSRKSA